MGKEKYNHNNTVIVDSKTKDVDIVSDLDLVYPVLDYVWTLYIDTRVWYAKNSTIDTAETHAWYVKNSLIDIAIDTASVDSKTNDVAVVSDIDSVPDRSTSITSINGGNHTNLDLEKRVSVSSQDF